MRPIRIEYAPKGGKWQNGILIGEEALYIPSGWITVYHFFDELGILQNKSAIEVSIRFKPRALGSQDKLFYGDES